MCLHCKVAFIFGVALEEKVHEKDGGGGRTSGIIPKQEGII